MRAFTIICACAAAAIAAPALAEDWQPAAETDSLHAFVDMDSIERTGNRVRFTQQWRHNKVRRLSDGLEWDTDTFLTEADCSERTFVNLETVARLRGRIVLSYSGTDRHQAEPNSLISGILDHACGSGRGGGTTI
ncbi:MAG TPA: surface-adhesin E family protein [Allosphingosinicella sp.]|jgi:hypothetical protein